LTVMRVIACGKRGGQAVRMTWDLLDFYDPKTGATSMARTTAFPCAIVARLIAAGRIDRAGVLPPELFGDDETIVTHILDELQSRGVRYSFTEENC